MYNREQLKKEVMEYITSLTNNQAYEKLINTSMEFKSACNKGDFPFQAHKLFECDNGEDAFRQAYLTHYYYDSIPQPKEPTFISEKYIRRNSIIDNSIYYVKEGSETYKMLKFAEILNDKIQYELISLEALWCMEFEIEDDANLDEFYKIMYYYFKFFVLIYLEYTNEICRKLDKKEEITDYQEEIDEIVQMIFTKREDKTKIKK